MPSQQNKQDEGMLTGFRALDLTVEPGCWLCGRLLGDLGADVIKIERPGGDLGRRQGPFYHDNVHPEKSLYWFAYNLNKRGVTLNLEASDGREIFKRLVRGADFVIESYHPGYMEKLGLAYDALSQLNPRVGLTSITPFGQSGPYANLKAYDLELSAMGNLLYQQGDPDRAPLRVSFPQAWLHAALEATVGTMLAHYHRQQTGEGQHVDVSAQESCSNVAMFFRPHWEATQTLILRSGPRSRWRASSGGGPRVIYPCKDGHFSYAAFGGELGARSNPQLVEWIASDGIPCEDLKSKDWVSFDYDKVTQEELDRITGVFASFFERHTKAELYDGCLQRGIMGAWVADAADIVGDPQLSAVGYWKDIYHEELDASIRYPGPFIKASQTPIRVRRHAPLIGEHNEEIYGKELGFSKEQLALLRQAGII